MSKLNFLAVPLQPLEIDKGSIGTVQCTQILILPDVSENRI